MRIRRLLILLLTLAFLAFPLIAHAADGGRLRLSAADTTLVVGQEVTVEVLVEDAPTIYGADVRLVFDPDLLEVVDADENTPGTQLKPGDFIDVTKSFVLQHGADNEAGVIDYALALLNPAPAVEGDGLLVRVTFRAKAAGRTTISIADGLFGTQTGETIAPTLDSVEVEITAERGGVLAPVTEPIRRFLEGDDTSQGSSTRGLVALGIVLVIGLVGVGLLGGWLWRKRNRRE